MYEPTRALLFAIGREPTKASHAVLNLLCHVSQDNIVIIVNGSEIAQYIQIFSETTQASGCANGTAAILSLIAAMAQPNPQKVPVPGWRSKRRVDVVWTVIGKANVCR